MRATARDLKGRKIVAVEFNPFDPNLPYLPRNYPGKAYDPVLTLDDGRRVWFEVQETEAGKYGVEICITGRFQ